MRMRVVALRYKSHPIGVTRNSPTPPDSKWDLGDTQEFLLSCRPTTPPITSTPQPSQLNYFQNLT